MLIEFLEAVFVILVALMVAYLVRHYIFTMAVIKNASKNKKAIEIVDDVYQPTVSILIPARNEEKVIRRILQRMTELTYPKDKLQVTVINDASTDTTGQIAEEYSKTYNFINVVHRSQHEGGRGKASALNAGLKYAKHEIIMCFDADYYPQRDILEKLTREFADPKVGAVQGRVIVLNEPQNMVTRLVALERIGGYLVDQNARDILGLIPQFGGTVGGFRHSLLKSLGGWDESVLAEDTDLTFRVYLAGHKIRYINDAECYEEAVENWRAYWRQRYRWAKGHMQCAIKHSFKVLKSSNLSLKEKIDGLLLLNVYFMPILVMLAWAVGIPLLLLKSSQWLAALWASVPVFLYSFVGNFAPFFEVGIGAYLDGRKRAQWLIPLMIFIFVYNMCICLMAFVDVSFSKIFRRNGNCWRKTSHSGNGNCYIVNYGNCLKGNDDSESDSNNAYAFSRSLNIHPHHASTSTYRAKTAQRRGAKDNRELRRRAVPPNRSEHPACKHRRGTVWIKPKNCP
jgi:cellulose synthase/poly-beta-1,6-N-acetylglucosamine synthase-like glycosyltransferase